nr:putative reverse transcriptase domain-containing protein [Tanacetum cinerariifolium]
MPLRMRIQSADRLATESLGGGTVYGLVEVEGVKDLGKIMMSENVKKVLVNRNRVGCSYKEFLACNPKEYDGKGGVVVLTRWIKKMENVQDMSGCSIDQRVKYTAGSFMGSPTFPLFSTFLIDPFLIGSSGSKTGKSSSAKKPVEEHIAEVVIDDAGDNMVHDDDQPKDTLGCYKPFDLSKPLPLQGPPGHQIAVVDYFFNNDLSPTKVGYDKDALKAVKHLGERRKLWTKSQLNKFSKHNVYSTNKILGVKSVSVKKFHGYGHLEEIVVKRVDQIDKVIKGCRLEIKGHVFDIDLIPFRHGCFVMTISMDWLSNHKAEIICHEKVVRIPLPDGKVLRVVGERPKEKARLLMSVKTSDKYQEEIVVVRDFPKVFLDDLSGLPPI